MQLEARIAAKEESLDKRISEAERKESGIRVKDEELEKCAQNWRRNLKKLPVLHVKKPKLILDATESKLKDEVS